MGDVVEISSDSSSDTVVPPLVEETSKDTSFDNALKALNDIDVILKKYTSPDVSNREQAGRTLGGYNSTESGPLLSSETYGDNQVATEVSQTYKKQSKSVCSDSEDELYVPLEKRLNLPNMKGSTSSDTGSLGSRGTRNSEEDSETGAKNKRQKNVSRTDKEAARLEKLQERQQRKEDLQREKAIKQALQNSNRNLKPDQATKFIKVHLANNIIKLDFSADIKVALENLGIAYMFQSQVMPDVITWTRATQSHLIDDSGELALSNDNIETNELLVILDWKNLVELVSTDSLVAHIQSVGSVYPNKKLCLCIFGLQRYYNYQKNMRRKEFRNGIAEVPQGNVKDSHLFKDIPMVTQEEIDMLITELQILCNLSCRRLETNQDVGLFVAQFSKSIAQLPYKLEQQKKQQEANWYMSGDNKDCVKVDKNGNGLNRLWHQQLTTFPLARLEIAEAIANKYPTPLQLMQAYDECTTDQQAQSLLQDIPIRRAAGPLTSVRKIGPEMSRRIFKFFTSSDGETLL